MIFQLVYMSEATDRFDRQTLQKLLVTSRRNNSEFNITGLLVYCQGHFMQLLEGDQKHVSSLYDVIKQDKRHRHIKTIVVRMHPEPIAPDWSMGLYEPSPSDLQDTDLSGFTLKDIEQKKNDEPGLMWSLVYRFITLTKNEQAEPGEPRLK